MPAHIWVILFITITQNLPAFRRLLGDCYDLRVRCEHAGESYIDGLTQTLIISSEVNGEREGCND